MNQDLEVARLIHATREEVFDAFTNPAGQEAFLGTSATADRERSHSDRYANGQQEPHSASFYSSEERCLGRGSLKRVSDTRIADRHKHTFVSRTRR
jgi:hypothetical protein